MTKAEEFARAWSSRPQSPQLFGFARGLIAEIGPWGDLLFLRQSFPPGDAIRLARWILEHFTEEGR